MVPTTAACSDSPRLLLAPPGTPWNPLAPPGQQETTVQHLSSPLPLHTTCFPIITSVSLWCTIDWLYKRTVKASAVVDDTNRLPQLSQQGDSKVLETLFSSICYFPPATILMIYNQWIWIFTLYPQQPSLIFNSSFETEYVPIHKCCSMYCKVQQTIKEFVE